MKLTLNFRTFPQEGYVSKQILHNINRKIVKVSGNQSWLQHILDFILFNFNTRICRCFKPQGYVKVPH
jgi:hypothetical protein